MQQLSQTQQILCSFFLCLLLCSCKDHRALYNGYIDADMTYLSSNFPGRLAALLVSRGEAVEPDQILFRVEQTSDNYKISMSEDNQVDLLAQRQEILDTIHYNTTNYQRIKLMRKDNAASESELDSARRDLDISTSQLRVIDAKIASNKKSIADQKWQMKRKNGIATDAGIIFDTYFTKGEFVQAGQPVVSLITQPNIKAIFYVAEPRLRNITLNAKVNIFTDGSSRGWTGKISYISNVAQYTPPIIYSREDRSKLVFRVEAKLDHPNLNHVHLGQPVTLELAHG